MHKRNIDELRTKTEPFSNERDKEMYIIKDKYNIDREKNIFLAKRILVDSVYQQANLEGIAVTFAQTQDILNNVNVDTLSPKDISKVCCLRDGWKYLFDNLDSKLDLVMIESLHEIVARFDVDYRYLGKLRTEQVLISGTNWKPAIPDFDWTGGHSGRMLNPKQATIGKAARV